MAPDAQRRFDGQIGDTLIEVKSGLNAVRTLRAGLVDLAYALQEMPASRRGLLVIADTAMSVARLEEEWRLAAQTFRPDIVRRLGVALLQNDRILGFPKDPPPKIRDGLRRIASQEGARVRRNLPRVEYYPEILKILVHQWFLGRGPMTASRLGEMAGCSYPSVAAALRRLSPVIKRHSDRRFELSRFPQEEWRALLATGDRTRHTVRFADRSGKPYAPETMVERIARLKRDDIAVGGVAGARGYFPDLDLVGLPRLDLTVHCPGHHLDTGFVQRLDPALKPVKEHEAPAILVVHAVRRRESLFAVDPAGVMRADPVECLIDLHEARLEPQAEQFFSFLTRRRAEAV